MKKDKIITIIIIIMIISLFKLFNLQDKKELDNAIARCGGDSANVVENYTRQGDIYYTCKNAKQ